MNINPTVRHPHSRPRGPLAATLFAALVVVVGAACASTPKRQADMNSNTMPRPAATSAAATQELTALLHAYEASLNAADVDAIVELYAADGVFMAQHSQPAAGHDEVRSAYRRVFEAIRLQITFEIDEVVVLSPTVAYARTRSTGTTTIVASGEQVSEGNQELFVLARRSPTAAWQISRYIFSTTQPPRI